MNSVGQRLPINAMTPGILEPGPPGWRNPRAAFLSPRALAPWRLCVFALKLRILTQRRRGAETQLRRGEADCLRQSLRQRCKTSTAEWMLQLRVRRANKDWEK